MERAWVLSAAFAVAAGAVACRRGDAGAGAEASGSAPVDATSASAPAAAVTFGKNAVAAPMPEGRPMLGVTAFVTIVFAEPRDTSKRLGYLRLGAKVPRSDEPVGRKGCEGGWYEIAPKGFVCAGKEATTDMEDPILRAAARRPDQTAALPYRYGFVRAVLPLYLKVPTAEEQHKSEFKLKDHLTWYEENKATVDKVALGAFDVPLDDRGVPLKGKQLGELGQRKNSLEVGLGVLFGGESDNDAPPFWLEGGKRQIPNVSEFTVPDYAVFADRARRFSGLALIGSFPTGEESLGRRFAITTDLRLAPTTKLKPDTGSPWHGIEIQDASELPFAFVREQGAGRFVVSGQAATRGEELAHRSVVPLTGKIKRVAGERYLATRSGDLVRASDVGVVIAPSAWPKAAEAGEKWIEVNVTQQTLVLWEGRRPVYATLVSTGREEYPTITGEFRIKSKHVTATMDSNENSDVGGGAPRQTAQRADDEPGGGEEAKSKSKSKSKKKKADGKSGEPKDRAAPAKIPKKGDGEYGITKRRGEGTYQLRDVPYIQYFAAGYALHGAYWHDVFGKPRSHGCVNLSPIDAHRVFKWTEPAIPEGWHAINTGEELGEGTTVIVHE
jgi:lipoprotein-anchoring transpeptidase ErfK/SrfK